MNGNTTRQIDFYIQVLFTNGKINEVIDHSLNKKNSVLLFEKIVARLALEHPAVKINANKKKLTIELIINVTN